MQTVSLPHICQQTPFHYFDESTYQIVSGYRKDLEIPAEWAGKRVPLTFEGIAHDSEVFLNGTSFETYRPRGLDPDARYRITNLRQEFNLKEFGSLVNQVSPIHIRQNSLLHNAASALIKMKGETEDCMATGEMLMNGSVKLKQGFGATGYAENIRFYKDFASRMYFMEQIE